MDTEKKLHKLIIDEEFKKLIPPLSEEELTLLEENIVRDGCREPICVWNNTIIDGHNRYSICVKNNIPFYIQLIEFENRVEVQNWICANQLGRRNISAETRKYLIGKRYQMEKQLLRNPNGKNQYAKLYKENEGLKEEREKNHRSVTAIKLGKEYQLGYRTVMDYGSYAKSLDVIEQKEPGFTEKILNGEIKIGQKTLRNLAKISPNIRKIETHIVKKPRIQLPKTKEIEHKVTIKDMPKYDPDAEVVSLSYTIPSWSSSIDRVLGKVEFTNISDDAKAKLKTELEKLDFSVKTLLMAMEGE